MKRTSSPAKPVPPVSSDSTPPPITSPAQIAGLLRQRLIDVLTQTKILRDIDLTELSWVSTDPYTGFGASSFKAGWVVLKLPQRDSDAPWASVLIPQTYEAPTDAQCFAAALHAVLEQLKSSQKRAEQGAAESERDLQEAARRIAALRSRIQEDRVYAGTLDAIVKTTEDYIASLPMA